MIYYALLLKKSFCSVVLIFHANVLQVFPNAISGTLFLGADSVAEAVAREVAAFSEASGLNMRQLQVLLSVLRCISSGHVSYRES